MTRFRLSAMQLFHRAPGLVHGPICVSRGACIAICDSDSAERLTPDFAGAFADRPFRIEQIVVLVSVAVRPSVHRNRGNVARRIESTFAENPRKLIAYAAFKSFERCGEQFAPPGSVLIPFRQTG